MLFGSRLQRDHQAVSLRPSDMGHLGSRERPQCSHLALAYSLDGLSFYRVLQPGAQCQHTVEGSVPLWDGSSLALLPLLPTSAVLSQHGAMSPMHLPSKMCEQFLRQCSLLLYAFTHTVSCAGNVLPALVPADSFSASNSLSLPPSGHPYALSASLVSHRPVNS